MYRSHKRSESKKKCESLKAPGVVHSPRHKEGNSGAVRHGRCGARRAARRARGHSATVTARRLLLAVGVEAGGSFCAARDADDVRFGGLVQT